MAKPFYNLPSRAIRFRNDYVVAETGLNEMQTYPVRLLDRFMRYVLQREQLTIEEYLDKMGQDPYFLLASTGLGKTVAAPIHSYLYHCAQIFGRDPNGAYICFGRRVPRIWIIEPKISIAQDQEEFMNALFADFIASLNDPRNVTHPALFGCKTSAKSSNYDAPIKFVTTGIFAIYARLGWFDPNRDCVIIDEAHVTIESSEGVELAIAICRQQGTPVHYMSATVDITGLHETLGVHSIVDATGKQRKPIWMHNTGHSMESCIVELVEKTLVYPDPKSEYFPKGNDAYTQEILRDVLEVGRAKGFLIVVNSFAGEDSDANKIAELLRSAPFGNQIEILLLASAIIRNPRTKRDFDQNLERIRRDKRKFVIIATSVVEMGVTFPDLDFVATGDSGYETITIEDTELNELAPLPVNSMKQRIGRVGRRRAGIGYVTNEVDAYYSSLSDRELNSKLRYEPIRLPLRRGSLVLVAQYSFKKQWADPIAELIKLNLPSKIHEDYDRVFEFVRQRQRLLDLGIAVDNRLTKAGEHCERWLDAGVDLGYAIRIQEALLRQDMKELLFFLVAATLSDVTLSTLLDKDTKPDTEVLKTRFNVKTGKPRTRKGIILRGEEIEFTPQSELIALYNIIAYFSNRYARMLFSPRTMPGLVRSSYRQAFVKDCQACGFILEKVETLLKAFTSILKVLQETNREEPAYQQMFGEGKELRLSDFSFPMLTEWDIQGFIEEVSTLPGRTRIILSNPQKLRFRWKELDGRRTGSLHVNATSVTLKRDQVISAKLVPLPGRGDQKAGDNWKLVHAQHEE